MNNYYITGTLMTKGDPISIDDTLYEMMQINKFEENVFPQISVDIKLSSSEFKKIDDDTILKLSIKEFLDNKKSSFYSYFIKDEDFVILEKQILNQTNSSTEDVMNVRLYLILKNDLLMNEINFNTILKDCDINGAMLYLLKHFRKKTIIESSDNDKTYDQIILPFNNFFREFIYLDNVYGIYKNGIKIFVDLDKAYILNKNDNKLETKKSIIIKVVEDLNEIGNTNDNTIYVLENKIFPSKTGNIQKQVTGNKNIFVFDSNEKMKVYKKEINNDGKKIKTFYQRYSNPFLRNRVNENLSDLFSLSISDANLDYLNCINDFYLNKEKMNLVECYNEFKRSGSNFALNTIMKIKKI